MADVDTRVLIRVGPFKGIDTRSASVYAEPGDCAVLSNVDTHRIGGAMSNAMGRQQLATLSFLGGEPIAALARYDVSETLSYYIVQGDTPESITVAYNPADGSQTYITGTYPPDSNQAFSQAVQSNGALFLNSGIQFFYGSDNTIHVAQWQYPEPDQNTYGYTVQAGEAFYPNHALADGTYYYAFVQVISLPYKNGTVKQSTTPAGGEPPYPYKAVVKNVTGNSRRIPIAVYINGTFAGTTLDGYSYVTQIYRMSSLDNAWNLLTTKTDNTTYVDDRSDQAIAGNQQLILNRDQPPTGISSLDNGNELNPIESFQDRMWVLTRAPNSFTKAGAQTQLWYSNEGQPWSFDSVNQVHLVGSDASTLEDGNVPVPYGDQVAGLAKVGSFLLIFKTLTTWILSGVDEQTYEAIPLFADIGCIAPASITKANGRCFWLSAQGCFSYDGANLDYISDKIYNDLQAIAPDVLAGAVGFYADLTWFLSFPGQGVTYAYYIPKKDWTTVPYATASAIFDPSLGSGASAATSFKFNQIVAAELNSQVLSLWLQGQQSDLGQPITARFLSPLTDSGEPHAQKDYRFVCVSAPQQSAMGVVKLYVDPGFPTAEPTWVSPTIDFSALPGSTVFSIPQNFAVGWTAQVEVTATPENGSAVPLQIWSVSVGGSVKRMWSRPSG